MLPLNRDETQPVADECAVCPSGKYQSQPSVAGEAAVGAVAQLWSTQASAAAQFCIECPGYSLHCCPMFSRALLSLICPMFYIFTSYVNFHWHYWSFMLFRPFIHVFSSYSVHNKERPASRHIAA